MGRGKRSLGSLGALGALAPLGLGLAAPLAAATLGGLGLKKKLGLAALIALKKKKAASGSDDEEECWQVPETHCYNQGKRYKRDAPGYGDQHCTTTYKTVCSSSRSRQKRAFFPAASSLLPLLGFGAPLLPLGAAAKAAIGLPLLKTSLLKKKLAALPLLKTSLLKKKL